MRHIILTRFNVRLTEEAQIPDETWLRHRIELFERFTAPSIAAQSVQPDAWIVFCAEESPDWLIGRVERVATVRRVKGVFARGAVGEAVEAGSDPLITTRLDNDDAIARDFLETIQREAPREGFINLTHGLLLFRQKLFRRSNISNPFISRIERGSCSTVMAAGPHSTVVHRYDVRQVKTEPMWMRVVHDHNLINAVGGMRTSCAHLKRFPVDTEVTDRGLRADQIRWLTRRGARAGRRLIRT